MRRSAAYLSGGLASLVITARTALAATPPTPPGPEPVDPGPDYLPLALIAAIGVAAVIGAWRSPGFRRVLAVGALVLLFLAGLLYVAAGFFGDLSGRHQVFVLAVVIGLGLIAASVIGLAWLWRRWSRRPAADVRPPIEPTASR